MLTSLIHFLDVPEFCYDDKFQVISDLFLNSKIPNFRGFETSV